MTRLPLLSALLVLTAACSLLPATARLAVDREAVPAELEAARQELAAGDTLAGVQRLIAVRRVPGLLPELRADAEDLLRSTVLEVLERYRAEEVDSGRFFALYDLDLPPTLRATAGILGAERLFAEGHPVVAWKRIRKVDSQLPQHGARTLAGQVLGEIGLWLIRNDGSYFLVFDYRERGVTALEYLVVNHPLSPACPDAYLELSRYYEETRDLDYAIERVEDLLLYHPGSPHTVEAEARLPYLRLERLRRDDYDRSQLELAAAEIDRWLGRYPDHERAEWVRELRRAAQLRLARNDLILARYYRQVESSFGTRIHAERALATAEQAGLEEAAAEARALLADLPAQRARTEELPAELPEFELIEQDGTR